MIACGVPVPATTTVIPKSALTGVTNAKLLAPVVAVAEHLANTLPAPVDALSYTVTVAILILSVITINPLSIDLRGITTVVPMPNRSLERAIAEFIEFP